MAAAGINPILAAGSPASSPSGGAAQSVMPQLQGLTDVIGALTGVVRAARH